MGGAPTRFDADVEDRLGRFDAQLRELEHRLKTLQAEEQRILDASARRVHDFERRLEHEWLALRQLHEEPLKTLEQRTTAITESCLNVVGEALSLLRTRAPAESAFPMEQRAKPRVERREAPEAQEAPEGSNVPKRSRWSRVAPVAALVGLVVLTGLGAYTIWNLRADFREASARAASSDARIVQLQQLVQRESRDTQQMVQRLTAEALTSSARAERLANVLAASDARAFPLRGQRAAAAAEGQVLFSPTRGIALTASKLPATSSNDVYQIWLVTSRGSIGLGLVSPDTQGRVGVAFETPPDLAGNVTGFMLSLEPAGGNTTPTGPIVLAS
jgi:hypothetical protein